MSTHKYIDRICAAVLVLTLVLTVLFMNGEALGIRYADRVMGYEDRLFDTSRVHTIDIVMDDWDGFIENCEDEEYVMCSAIIDGEAYKNIAIRAKGNTSLSQVRSMGSQRYSFKVEFDHYDKSESYYGLDKLCLNNIIQDTTYMKDYLSYRLMDDFGVDAPLCSYTYITVNGGDWGLYLAVEGVEDGFLQRNYGSSYGELYKPDSMSFGGGRGNGRDFDMDDFMGQFDIDLDSIAADLEEKFGVSGIFDDGFDMDALFKAVQDNAELADYLRSLGKELGFGDFSDFGGMGIPDGVGGAAIEIPDDGASGMSSGGNMTDPPEVQDRNASGDAGGRGFGGMGGISMGSSDVKLQYIDDNPESYSNIFSSAKTDISDADEVRLIAALKRLGEGDIEGSVDIDEVLRYAVVHNFLVNGDSYTGSMIHNYYLYEKDGLLSMIPWDYNLAFGSFQGSSASSAVNDAIDTPLSVTGNGDRPIIDWIFSDKAYTELYHEYFTEFLDSADIVGIIDSAADLIAPYVEKDPTAFYSYDEFKAGVEALRTFCELRMESVLGQLDGTIPSTDEGQTADSAALVDASALSLSDMGSMSMGGMGGNRGGNRDEADADNSFDGRGGNMPQALDGDFQGGDAPQMPDGEMPEMPSSEMSNGSFDESGRGGNRVMPDGQDRDPAQGRVQGSRPDETAGVLTGTFLPVGVSMLFLLTGFLIAWKVKH